MLTLVVLFQNLFCHLFWFWFCHIKQTTHYIIIVVIVRSLTLNTSIVIGYEMCKSAGLLSTFRHILETELFKIACGECEHSAWCLPVCDSVLHTTHGTV